MITDAKLVEIQADPAEYHQQDAERGCGTFVMSRSELMTFFDNPWKWLQGFDQEDSDATNWGSRLDTLVLDNGRFGQKFSICPKEYPHEVKGEKVMKPWNRNATYCQEWEAMQPGRTVLKPHEEAELLAAREMLLAHPEAAEILNCSQKQVWCKANWTDKATKVVVPVKILIDLLPDKDHPKHGKRIFDFKTAASANPNAWPYVCNRFGYHVQAAMYLDIYCAATGEDRTDWAHLVQENTPPYCVELIGLDSETIDAGRDIYKLALSEYARCLQTNQWRSYYVNRDNATVIVDGMPLMKMIPQMQAPAFARMTYLKEERTEDPTPANLN